MPEEQAAAIQSPNSTLGSPGLPLDRLERAVLDLAARLEELQATAVERGQHAEAMERQSADLEQKLAVAEARLAVEMMHSAGLAAQASHLMAIAAEAGLPALSELVEERDAGGAPRSRLAEIYAAAFDAKAADLGIEDPARFREA